MVMTEISPFAPAHFPQLPPVGGVRLAVAAAGIRYRDRNDVLLVELQRGTAVAGSFTRSQTAAAPVQWSHDAVAQGQARVLVVNAGNANAFTGLAGPAAVEDTVTATVALFACRPSQVFVASTGVIGEALPVDRLTGALPDLHKRLGEDGWEAAAWTIATTDTFAKGAGRTVEIDGVPVAIAGIAKGSGMIAPDLATMLVFIFTDAAIAAPVLQLLLDAAISRSFNCITVDGDTSTNDTVLLFATGAAGNPTLDDSQALKLAPFREALEAVCLDLAQQIVRDGEGVTKFVTLRITGAQDDEAARQIGLTVANSPLVKTAIAGSDANWGRIVAAVGRTDEWIDRDRLAIRIGGVPITEDGGPVPDYDETPVAEHMRGREIEIEIDVGVGVGTATIWTGDLTHGYININADYRS